MNAMQQGEGARRRRRRASGPRAALLAALTCATLGLGGSQAAAATWSVQTGAALTGELRDVSCASGTRCTAVGESGGARAVVETWNGTYWVAQEAAVPREAARTSLLAVSCTSESFCVAAGYYRHERTGETKPLVEMWNGSAWSVVGTAFGGFSFRDVSCSSESACTVVGEGWVYRWNGTEWRAQLGTSVGRSVVCTSGTSCMTIGEAFDEATMTILPGAWTWNGTSWRRTTVPAPASARTLSNLACTSSTFCMSITPGTERFSERWNGTEWIQGTLPFQPLAASNGLACASTTFCVGLAPSAVAYWNGTEWSTEALPQPEGTERVLAAISCTSSTACTLVGRYRERGGSIVPLIERYS